MIRDLRELKKVKTKSLECGGAGGRGDADRGKWLPRQDLHSPGTRTVVYIELDQIELP